MKTISVLAAFIVAAPLALGQAPVAPKPAPAKPAAKQAQPKVSASRAEVQSTANQMAAGVEAAEAALTPAALAVAERIDTGRIPCELGSFVTITADPKAPGYFTMETQKFRFRMSPVESRTGALRLEDPKNGAVWIQLANKSMLMNQKIGQRLADECMSPAQAEVAAALKKNPMPSILDPLPGAPPGGGTVAIPVTVPQIGVTTTVVLTSTSTAVTTPTPSGTPLANPAPAASTPAQPASAPR